MTSVSIVRIPKYNFEIVVIVGAVISLLVVLGISECIMRTAGFAGRSQEARQVTASKVGMPDLEENIMIDLVG